MEYRIKDYIISGNSIILPRKTGIEDIRLIYNETQKVLICSTAKKDNLWVGDITTNVITGKTTINVPASICVLNESDNITIKCDYGDDTTELAKEQTLTDVANTLAGKIDQAQNTLLSRSVKYDKQTGNLTIENVELIIE